MLQPVRDALLAPGSAYETVEEDVRGEAMLLVGRPGPPDGPTWSRGDVRLDSADHLGPWSMP